jgi:RHS repeat-associated protein
VVLETDASSSNVQARYTLGESQLLAQTRGSSGMTSYYLPDGQESVRALADSSGSITDQYRYDAYGNLLSSTGSTTNPYRYTGQRLDVQTGLYQLWARAHDPSSGRFLSRDTAEVDLSNPLELNRYSYASDNPISLADPSGRQPLVEHEAQVVQKPEQTKRTVAPVVVFVVVVLAIIIGVLLIALAPGANPNPGPIPTPTPRPNSMRMQLQQQVAPNKRLTHQGIPYVDTTGSGVTTAQVVPGLQSLLTNPVIPNSLRADAARANAQAVAWVQSRPANGGLFGVVKKSFYFGFKDSGHNWSFDVDNLVRHNRRV